MTEYSRRTFLKTAAGTSSALAITPLIPSGWFNMKTLTSQNYFEHNFDITDALCQRILNTALAKGGDFSDLYFEHTVDNYLVLEDGKVNRAYCDVSLGVGIRTVMGDQVGYGFTQELNESSILKAATTASTIANASMQKPQGKFITAKHANYYPLEQLLRNVPVSSKLPLIQSTNEKCFARSPLVQKVNVTFYDQEKRILLVTSDGQKSEDLLPRNFLAASVVLEKNGQRERASWNRGGRYGFSFYTPTVIDDVAQTAVDQALTLFEAVQPPAGEMPIVLGPGQTGVLLHEAIGHGMEADFNRKNISTYSQMLGKKVAEPFVTILDDGTNPKLPGSINIDDEGTPSQKTILVDNGVLRSFMHDKISARHYKLPSTGNGRRESYEHFVVPRMRNTYMQAGPATPEDVIKNVKKGIYVQDVSNGQVKIGEGDFAFFVSQGKMIENGKLTAPIKDMNIMGNGPKMLKNITMVANDLAMASSAGGACGKAGQRVPVGFGMPTVLVKSMTVGGTKA